jgi:hypothetical protein
MQNLTVHLGSGRGGPRVPALSTAPADRPAPPVSGTVVRHCATAHPSAPYLPALSGRHARAAHVAHERRARAAAGCRPQVGARPHGTSAPCGTPPPTPGTPTFFPHHSPLPHCRRAARSLLALLHSFPRPHSSSTPPLERPSFPTAPHTRTAAFGHRQPPLPRGFRSSTAVVRHSSVSSSPSYQSPKFLANPSLPRLS